jgi:hypothetical protein
MLSREKFKEYMLEAKELLDISDNIHTALKPLSSSNEFFLEKPFNTIINLLRDVMNDKYDYILYFICDLEWGKSAKEDSVTEDGKPIPLFTLDDLYDRLMSLNGDGNNEKSISNN